MVKQYVRFGASPRGAQAVLLAAKITALFGGRFAASTDDVKASARPALRHRVLLNFEGEAEGVKSDLVIFDLAGLEGAGALQADGRFPPLANAVAARPSGTEPKIKFYLFAAAAPDAADELAATKRALTARLDALERDLRALVGV
jgi:phosphomannomutase